MESNNQPPWLDEADVYSDVTSSMPEIQDSDATDPDEVLAKRWAQEETRAFHWVKMICIRGIPILAGVCIIVYFWHIIGFPCMRWMSEADLKDLRSIVVSVLSGVVSSVAVGYFYRNK